MDKLSIYEVLSWLVPGMLLLGFVGILCPEGAKVITLLPGPDAFKASLLAAAAVFLGQIAQAIASIAEPLLHLTWGGRPSEVALTRGLGDRYLPKDTGTRIQAALKTAVGQGASDRSLFLYAMQRAEAVPDSKAKNFNAQYAYHRVLLTLTALVLIGFAGAWFGGYVANINRNARIGILLILIALVALLWYRTKQRAYYYVREVLLAAERLLQPASATK